MALAFIGAGSKDNILSARAMMTQLGNRWAVEWLRTKGLSDWAGYLDTLRNHAESAVEAVTFKDLSLFQTDGKLRGGEILQ